MTSSSARPVRYRIADAGDAIRRRETFVAGDGSLIGDRAPAGEITESFGRLPIAHAADLLQEHVNYGAELYVVRSYGTPIAWAGPGESLTVPDVRYSVTTSRHQGIARRADDVRPEDMTATERRIVRAMIRQEHGAAGPF